MGEQQGSAISDFLNIAGLAYHNGQPAEPYTVPDGYSSWIRVRMRQGLCECRIIPRARPGTGGGVERWNAA